MICRSPNDVSAVVAAVGNPGRYRGIKKQPASSTSATNRTALHASIAEVLRQGETLLRSIDDEKYVRKLRPAFNSAIGGHYRHCLDHFTSLLEGLDADEVNYDHRARDHRIENDRAFALAETQGIFRACMSIPAGFLDCPINVRSQVSYENAEDAPRIGSTVGRELMYAVAHTIHHYALIAVMCGLLEVVVPNGFGVAPSTLRHRHRQKSA